MADAAGGGDVGAARVAQLEAVPAVLAQRLVRVTGLGVGVGLGLGLGLGVGVGYGLGLG